MDTRGWIKTLVFGGIGGGLAGAFAAATNPAEYQFPHDFGSGKLWKWFFQGAFLTIGALLLKSPWGVKLVGEFKNAQQQLSSDKQMIAEMKSDLKKGGK